MILKKVAPDYYEDTVDVYNSKKKRIDFIYNNDNCPKIYNPKTNRWNKNNKLNQNIILRYYDDFISNLTINFFVLYILKMGVFGNILGGALGSGAGQFFGGDAGRDAGNTIGGLLGGLLPFKKGGRIKKTGPAYLHSGEFVLPKSVKPTKAQKAAVAKLHKKKKGGKK